MGHYLNARATEGTSVLPARGCRQGISEISAKLGLGAKRTGGQFNIKVGVRERNTRESSGRGSQSLKREDESIRSGGKERGIGSGLRTARVAWSDQSTKVLREERQGREDQRKHDLMKRRHGKRGNSTFYSVMK